jgi:hypothetical protein
MFVEERRLLFELIDGQKWLPCHHFLPDDVAELPCVVVGPPSAEPGDVRTSWDIDTDVFVLGRRYGDEDSQHELDQYARELANILFGANLNVQSIQPRLVTVAGQDIPGYVATVRQATIQPC